MPIKLAKLWLQEMLRRLDCLGRKKAEIQSTSSNNLKSTLENVKSRFMDTHQKFRTNQNGYFRKHSVVCELRF